MQLPRLPWPSKRKQMAPLTAELGQRVVLMLATFFMVTLVVNWQWMPKGLQLAIGQPAPRTIIADKTVKYEDKDRTEQLRAGMADLVEPVYDPDIGVLEEAVADLRLALERTQLVRSSALPLEEKADQLSSDLNLTLPAIVVQSLLDISEEDFALLKIRSVELLGTIMEHGIREDELALARLGLTDEIELENGSTAYKRVLQALIDAVLTPNLVYNEGATEKRREEARSSIQPVEKTIWQNTVIVREGDPISTEHLETLEALDLLRKRINWTAVLGRGLLIAVLMILTVAYSRSLAPKLGTKFKLQLLLSWLVVGTLALGRLILSIPISGAINFFPAAAGPLLVAILIDGRLAVLITMALSTLLALMAELDVSLFLITLIGSLAGVLVVQKVRQRNDLIRAGFFIGCANVFTTGALGLVAGSKPLAIASTAMASFTQGLLVAVLTIGVLPFIEMAFGITTPVRLLELADPNHPLLRRLLLEAPGTYHHSILVGNLAETAADGVEADVLLVRAASYYHDIGKINSPGMFIENQLAGTNPHDDMDPEASAAVIIDHIEQGLKLAREYKLPPSVADIVLQHHGTTLVSYFYHRALKRSEGSVDESSFRYPGPIPQTREAAIVMLADAAEAAVRSCADPTAAQTERLVKKIIKMRLDDGQLAQSDLTLGDLDRIEKLFIKVLTGIYHHRVSYPTVSDQGDDPARIHGGN